MFAQFSFLITTEMLQTFMMGILIIWKHYFLGWENFKISGKLPLGCIFFFLWKSVFPFQNGNLNAFAPGFAQKVKNLLGQSFAHQIYYYNIKLCFQNLYFYYLIFLLFFCFFFSSFGCFFFFSVKHMQNLILVC